MWEWIKRTHFFKEQGTNYVFFYLNGNLTPQLKFGTSSVYMVLNYIKRFILVTFKSHIPKSEVQKLGD